MKKLLIIGAVVVGVFCLVRGKHSAVSVLSGGDEPSHDSGNGLHTPD